MDNEEIIETSAENEPIEIPEDPVTPDVPEEPIDPSEPEEPTNPDGPDDPDNPDEPEEPDEPKIDVKESILLSIKKLMIGDPESDAFDVDLILAINSAFMVLNQLGIGPDHPFRISGSEELWTDFLGDSTEFEAVKDYVYLKARLLFDPPTSGVLHEAMERQVSEYEWRLNVQAETPPHKPTPEEEEDQNERSF